MLCEESGQTCGQQRIFSFTTTMLPLILHLWSKAFLAKNSMPLIRQAPYSPDLAPCDFWLFPFEREAISVKRRHYEKSDGGFSGGGVLFEKWQKRWDKCVNHQGEYFEGDYKTCKIYCVVWSENRPRIYSFDRALSTVKKCADCLFEYFEILLFVRLTYGISRG